MTGLARRREAPQSAAVVGEKRPSPPAPPADASAGATSAAPAERPGRRGCPTATSSRAARARRLGERGAAPPGVATPRATRLLRGEGVGAAARRVGQLEHPLVQVVLDEEPRRREPRGAGVGSGSTGDPPGRRRPRRRSGARRRDLVRQRAQLGLQCRVVRRLVATTASTIRQSRCTERTRNAVGRRTPPAAEGARVKPAAATIVGGGSRGGVDDRKRADRSTTQPRTTRCTPRCGEVNVKARTRSIDENF